MPEVTISIAQMNVKDGDPRKNWATVQELVAEAARRGSDLIVLPELWDNGYQLDRAKDFASALAGGLFAQVAALAGERDVAGLVGVSLGEFEADLFDADLGELRQGRGLRDGTSGRDQRQADKND